MDNTLNSWLQKNIIKAVKILIMFTFHIKCVNADIRLNNWSLVKCLPKLYLLKIWTLVFGESINFISFYNYKIIYDLKNVATASRCR